MSSTKQVFYSILLITLFLIDVNGQLKAQQKIIKGKITTIKGGNLDAVTISTVDGKGTVSTPYGKFRIVTVTEKEKVKLNFRRLGYQTLDTTISVQDSVTIEIALKEMIYQQEAVEIVANQFNIFQKNNWKVYDYMIYQDYFIFLYRKKGKKLLGLFDADGFLIHEQKVSAESYKKMEVSCTGSILLIGKWECGEYYLLDERIYLLKYHGIKQYVKFLKPCLAKLNNEFYFKDFSDHNKRINYYTIPNKRSKKLLYVVYDSVAAGVAEVYYRDILIAYTNAVRNNYVPHRLNHTDYLRGDDLTQPHLINDGLWDGDLKKLMIDRETESLVTQYLQLESKPIYSANFVADPFIYVFDYVNQKFIQINTSTEGIEEQTLIDFPWQYRSIIVEDQSTMSINILSLTPTGNYILFKLNKNYKGAFYVQKISHLHLEGENRSSIYIHNARLYYLAHYLGRSSQLKWIDIK